MSDYISKGADLSYDRVYRYSLYREWSKSKSMIMFIGLNPSTADENEDDPTIRRCVKFAKDWGHGGIYMLNLFALRTKDPKILLKHPSPVGQKNDFILKEIATDCLTIVAAWGTKGNYLNRDKEVISIMPLMHCLGITKDGHPKHPLYLSKDTKRISFTGGIRNEHI